MRLNARRLSRGFTMVELMIVVAVVAIMASIAIPYYQKLTARSYRSEMMSTLSKFRLYFKNTFDGQGTFSTPQTLGAGLTAAINPPSSIPAGQPGEWRPHASGWEDMPFPPEGAVRMRYWYTMGSPDSHGNVVDITFLVCGHFPGIAGTVPCASGMEGNYLYTEVFHGNGTSEIAELPDVF